MYSGQDTFYGSQKPEPGSQSQVIATRTLISDSQGGFPHSEIPGSKPAHGSPGLIAACHVLHRLYAPRHPPNALQTLERHSNSPPMHRDNRTGRTGTAIPDAQTRWRSFCPSGLNRHVDWHRHNSGQHACYSLLSPPSELTSWSEFLFSLLR